MAVATPELSQDALVEMLSLIAEKADVDFLSTQVESSVQHVKRASLVCLGW